MTVQGGSSRSVCRTLSFEKERMRTITTHVALMIVIRIVCTTTVVGEGQRQRTAIQQRLRAAGCLLVHDLQKYRRGERT